jgi:hypothetical protein
VDDIAELEAADAEAAGKAAPAQRSTPTSPRGDVPVNRRGLSKRSRALLREQLANGPKPMKV